MSPKTYISSIIESKPTHEKSSSEDKSSAKDSEDESNSDDDRTESVSLDSEDDLNLAEMQDLCVNLRNKVKSMKS